MGQEGATRDELKRLFTKLKHALDMRDRVDSELRKLEAALEEETGAELEETVKTATELLKLLRREKEEVDELITRASSALDKLRAISLWRRLSAAFGGVLIFIGAMAITSGLFTVFLGILSGLVAPEVESILGLASIALGALLVLSGFAHQLP
ncbi:hypothetical protein DRO33_05140 [Candidatus Bathyarchaeota archaeon]|nr:MAG: hypothetical protein DRO33_05140 [Candidatus Bathyarchaeota archaeon]